MGCFILILVAVFALWFGVWPVLGVVLLICATLFLAGLFCD